jgi:hypothetical protein
MLWFTESSLVSSYCRFDGGAKVYRSC